MTIHPRLRTLILILLLPAGLIGTSIALHAAAKQRGAMEQDMRDVATALMHAIETELQASIDSLETLGHSASLRNNDLKAFRADTGRAMAARNDKWINVLLYDPTAQQKVNMMQPVQTELRRSRDSHSVIEAALRQRPVLGHIRTSFTSDRRVFSLRVPVIQAGKTAYVLSAVLDADTISRIVDKQAIPDSWLITVIDQNDRYVIRRPATETNTALVDNSGLNVVSSAHQGWEKGRLADGTPIFRAHQRSSLGGWAASITVPQYVLNRSLYGVWALGALCAIAAAIGLWTALRLIWQLAGPAVWLAGAGTASLCGSVSAGPMPPARQGPENAPTFKEAAPALREVQQPPAASIETRPNNRARIESGWKLTEPVSSPYAATTSELDATALDLAQLADKLIYGWHCDGKFARHTVTTQSESVWVHVDRACMERILSSLLGNALKHTPIGGHIEVTIFRGGEYAVLRVSDDGGMKLDALDDLFSPFLRNEADRTTDSSGLAMAQQLVEQQGGSINISSEGPHKGTRLAVLLPAVEEPPMTH